MIRCNKPIDERFQSITSILLQSKITKIESVSNKMFCSIQIRLTDLIFLKSYVYGRTLIRQAHNDATVFLLLSVASGVAIVKMVPNLYTFHSIVYYFRQVKRDNYSYQTQKTLTVFPLLTYKVHVPKQREAKPKQSIKRLRSPLSQKNASVLSQWRFQFCCKRKYDCGFLCLSLYIRDGGGIKSGFVCTQTCWKGNRPNRVQLKISQRFNHFKSYS